MQYRTIDLSTKRDGREVKWQAEAPQVETLSELEAFAGSADAALDWVNSHLAIDAGNAGRPTVRDAEKTVPDEEAIAKAQENTKGYVPRGARAPGVKAKAQAMDELLAAAARGEDVSALLEAASKKFGA